MKSSCWRPGFPRAWCGLGSGSKTLTAFPKTSKLHSIMSDSNMSDAHVAEPQPRAGSAGNARYTLYYVPGAASFAVHWMLLEVGAPFELIKVDLGARAQRSVSYLALNP